MRITAYAASDVGRHREINEDNMFSGSTVFAVADGMGGHAAGEVASETALQPIAELDGRTFDDPKAATDALRSAVEAANRNVVSQAKADPNLSGMGTTLTAVLLRGDRLHLAHVGDSRAYLLRPGEQINQLTTDHTLVEQLVQDGRLSRDQVSSHPQRSVITRAIGVDTTVEVDTLEQVLAPGDQVVLCSDGLSGPVSDPEISELLMREPDGDQAVARLVQAANDAGGPDNITVVLLRVEPNGDGAAVDDDTLGDEYDDDTNEEDTTALDTAAVAPTVPPRSIPIRTRPESENHDWATDMSRYANRQRGDGSTGKRTGRGRGRRLFGVLAGVVVLLGILLAGGYLLLSRAYFIGPTPTGNVGIFTGINDTVAGIPLYRQASDTGVAVESLPPVQQQRVREGMEFGSKAEAEEVVANYRTELEEAQPRPGGTRKKPPPDATPAP